MNIIEDKVEKLEVQAKAHQISIEELNTKLFLVAFRVRWIPGH